MPKFPFQGFAPEPSVIRGGIARLIRCWESCRDANEGGYKGGVVQTISDWTRSNYKLKVTSCSPFTATVIGMIFDDSNSEAPGTLFEPKYDGNREPLPPVFYHMHNGFYFDEEGVKRARLKKLGIPTNCDGSTESLVFWNLGYEIDPKDMRRGDMVGINWENRGGHATFCWDVHLAADQTVDCFLYLSSNGGIGKGGAGVTVGVRSANSKFVKQSKGKYTKVKSPLFADDVLYIEHGAWMCLPKVAEKAVDKTTFNGVTPRHVVADGSHSVASLKVVRLWGVAPPTRPQTSKVDYAKNFATARRLSAEEPPPPFASGTSTPVAVHVKDVPSTKVPAKQAETPKQVKEVPPKPAKQLKTEAVDHQLVVEQSLHELFVAGWIEKDPGPIDSVYDAQTKAAVEDFQTRFAVEPIDGKPGRITRSALARVMKDLHDGKPNPHKEPEQQPRVDDFYWLRNRALPGDSVTLAIRGANLDALTKLDVVLTCAVSEKSASVALPTTTLLDHTTAEVAIPSTFPRDGEIAARLIGSGKGAKIDVSTDVPLYLTGTLSGRGAPPPMPADPADLALE